MTIRSMPDLKTAPRFETRYVTGRRATELYITAMPSPGSNSLQEETRRLFSMVRRELVEHEASIFSERLFATREAMPIVEAVRAEVYGDLDDGVPPTRLLAPVGSNGPLMGVQVHAVAGCSRPRPARCWSKSERTSARIIESGKDRWLFIHGLSIAASGDKPEEVRRAFYCAGCFLRQAGGSMRSVARTWLWLHDINAWYQEFNQVRHDSFRRQGLLDPERNLRLLPASTGVGIDNANQTAYAMDLIAVPGRENTIDYIESSGDQGSAFTYGSAFSRASVVPMPAGRTLYISGTAAIDSTGATEHVGDIVAQIDDTIAHVRALLEQQSCGDDDVLTAIVYCKDLNVERIFRQRRALLPWPHVVVIAEICRPELLVEIELTARIREDAK